MSFKDKIKKAARSVWGWLVAAALAVAVFFGYDAQSQTVITDTLTWTAPTQYTDNTPIPPGTITGYRYVWGTTPGGPYPNSVDVGNVLTVQVSRPLPGYGTRCYKVAALVGAANGEFSNEGCKTVQAPPKAPGNFSVQ